MKYRVIKIFASSLAVITVFLLASLMARPAVVKGPSMEPAYKDGQIVFVNTLNRSYRVGDAVVIDGSFFNGSVAYGIKRISALPGVKVDTPEGEAVVPEGAVFVLGDNEEMSLDSRELGFLPIEKIKGVVYEVRR